MLHEFFELAQMLLMSCKVCDRKFGRTKNFKTRLPFHHSISLTKGVPCS
jgi:hypothetical protein